MNSQLTNRILDAKRYVSDERLKHAADSFSAEISEMQPDMVIISDDEAVKYMRSLMVKKPETPLFFVGLIGRLNITSFPGKM